MLCIIQPQHSFELLLNISLVIFLLNCVIKEFYFICRGMNECYLKIRGATYFNLFIELQRMKYLCLVSYNTNSLISPKHGDLTQ